MLGKKMREAYVIANYLRFRTRDVICDVTDYLSPTVKYYDNDVAGCKFACTFLQHFLFSFIAAFVLFYFTCADGFNVICCV